jgi:hypothetical protein
MARNLTAGSSHNGAYGSAVVTGPPMTMFCRFKASSVSGGSVRRLITVNALGTTDNYLSLYFTSGSIYAQQFVGSDASATTSVSAGVWNNAAGVYNTNASRQIYLNGTLGSAETTSLSAPSGVNCVGVGKIDYSGGAIQFYDGDIADVALWSVALSLGELDALNAGVRPHRIRPSSLQAYWPLLGIASPEPDYSPNGRNLTITGAVAANHAAVFLTTKLATTIGYLVAAPTTATISGTVTLSGSPQSGAIVTVTDETTGALIGEYTTDGSGNWSTTATIGHSVSAMVRYTSGGTDYRSKNHAYVAVS